MEQIQPEDIFWHLYVWVMIFFWVSQLFSCDAQKNRLLRRGAFGKHGEHKCTFGAPLSGLTPRPLRDIGSVWAK